MGAGTSIHALNCRIFGIGCRTAECPASRYFLTSLIVVL